MMDIPPGRWENLDGLSDELLEQLREEGKAVVTEAALYFEGEIKTQLTGQRSGHAYKVSQKGPLHIASAPGESPAVLFGALRNSIGHEDARVVDGYSIESYVGVGLGVRERSSPAGVKAPEANDVAPNYAPRLEYGGVDSRGVRILPRPYMEPARLRAEPIIADMLSSGVGSQP